MLSWWERRKELSLATLVAFFLCSYLKIIVRFGFPILDLVGRCELFITFQKIPKFQKLKKIT